MKKAAAFLTLLALLVMTGGALYLQQREASPKLSDLQPALDNLKTFIPETLQMPAAAGIAVFALLVFLLSLAVLFERRCLPVVESATKAAETPAVENKAHAELELLKKKVEEAESAQAALKRQISDLDADNAGLKGQLEKLRTAPAADKELEKAMQLAADLENRIKEASAAREKLVTEQQQSLLEVKNALNERNRLQTEVDALIARAEKSENDAKSARRDSEKVSGQLKTAQSELEKKSDEITNLRQQLETLNNELKSARANQKGGKEAIPPAAYQILYLFQKEGRLIDLLSEDITELDDETLGGAIRPIHEGCRRLLADRLILERVLNEEEGSIVTLDEIDPEAVKLSGRVPPAGPYKGELIHRGWRLKECNLPELVDGWKGNVIAPAEVEIS